MSKPDTRRRYSAEFKASAVALVDTQGYGVSEAARRLGISRSLLDRWRRQQRGAESAGAEPVAAGQGGDERDAELRRLREENRRLREERTVLKKATAFVANESN